MGVSPNGGSPNGSSPNDPLVQLGVVQMGVVQLGVFQLGVVQMGVDPVMSVRKCEYLFVLCLTKQRRLRLAWFNIVNQSMN